MALVGCEIRSSDPFVGHVVPHVGLGLAIAKAAVEMHHGEIHATRNTSSGLAVSIAVPMDGQKQWNGNSPQNTN